MEWYDAMATSDELDLLSPPIPGGTAKDAGQQRSAVYELHRLVKARLAAAWSDNGGEVPRKLLKAKAGVMTAGALETRLSDLANPKKIGKSKKRGGMGIVLKADRVAFQVFRRENPKPESESATSASWSVEGPQSP